MGSGCSRFNAAATRQLHELLVDFDASAEEVRRLLDAGADPLCPHPTVGYTPLTLACLNRHEGIVALLTRNDLVRNSINMRSGLHGVRITALHAAVMSENANNIACVLKHASPDVVDHNGATPSQILSARRDSMHPTTYAAIRLLFNSN